MNYLLAQAPSNVVELLSHVFGRADTLTQPQSLVDNLSKLSIVWAVVFIVAGVLCLINGFRYYKTVVVILALAIGVVAGYQMGRQIQAEIVVAGCLGLLLAVGAMPLMKYAVAVMGGLIGAFVGANLWSSVGYVMSHGQNSTATENYWVGALCGLIICGMLAFLLFNVSVALFTSVSGATIAVIGALALVLQIDTFRPTVAEKLEAHQAVIPMLVLVPAVIGLIFQQASKAPGKGGGGEKKPATA